MGVVPRARRGDTALCALVVGLGLAAAARLFLPPAPVESAAVLVVWSALGLGIGLVVGRWWALALAILPWPGIWYTRATGPEYLSRPNDIPAWFGLLLIAAPGFAGLALGIGLRRTVLASSAARWPRPARAAGRLALAAALLAPGGVVLLEPEGGGRFLRPVGPATVPRRDAGEVRAAAAGLDFAIYGAPPGEGEPTAALRNVSSSPGLGPTETLTLIYCDDRCRQASEVQITSAPPRYGPAARQRGGGPDKPVPTPAIEPLAIGGVIWELRGTGPLAGAVTADAILPDAYVRIGAPDRATFARIAAGLRRVGP